MEHSGIIRNQSLYTTEVLHNIAAILLLISTACLLMVESRIGVLTDLDNNILKFDQVSDVCVKREVFLRVVGGGLLSPYENLFSMWGVIFLLMASYWGVGGWVGLGLRFPIC